MRKIKFRVWNGEQMVWPDYLDRDGIAHWTEDSIPTSSAEVMFFTGLKDRSGEEIYEGDIFRQKGMDDDLIVGEVIFDEGYHGFRVKEGNYIYHWLKFAGEVIGNVYEHPELLKS